MLKKLLTVALSTLILGAGAVAGEHSTEKVSPADALKEVVEWNNSFVKSHSEEYFKPYMNAQHPTVTLVTCSDARVQTTALFKDPVDKVFVIRNIGNQLANARGSVDYGIYHLHTPILLILGHTHCGAVKAALHNYSNETEGIKEELDHLHLPLLPLVRCPSGNNFEKTWLDGVERNVNYQVQEAVNFYKPFIKEGKLAVVGAVYDFINAYGKGYGRLVIINVNGETDPKKLENSPVLKELSEQMKKEVLVTR